MLLGTFAYKRGQSLAEGPMRGREKGKVLPGSSKLGPLDPRFPIRPPRLQPYCVSDRERCLGFELAVHLTCPEVVGGLIGGHTPYDVLVESPVVPLEGPYAPYLHQLRREQAVEVSVGES